MLELTQELIVGVGHWNELNPRARFDNGWVRREEHDLEVRAIAHQQLIAKDHHLGIIADAYIALAFDWTSYD